MIQQDHVSQYLFDLELAVVHDICKLLNTGQHPTEDLESTHSTLRTHMMSIDSPQVVCAATGCLRSCVIVPMSRVFVASTQQLAHLVMQVQ